MTHLTEKSIRFPASALILSTGHTAALHNLWKKGNPQRNVETRWQFHPANAQAMAFQAQHARYPASRKRKEYLQHYNHKKEKRRLSNRRFVLALPIFPGRRQPSIVGRNELNYRVRNGNGWTLDLISTNYLSIGFTRRTNHIIATSCRLVKKKNGDPYRIRTDVNGVRGRCLNHLTNGPWCTFTDSNRGPTD